MKQATESTSVPEQLTPQDSLRENARSIGRRPAKSRLTHKHRLLIWIAMVILIVLLMCLKR